jgi:REJ domain
VFFLLCRSMQKSVAQRRSTEDWKKRSASNRVREVHKSIADVIVITVILIICVLTITKGYDAQLVYAQSSGNESDSTTGSDTTGSDTTGSDTTGSNNYVTPQSLSPSQIPCPDGSPQGAVCHSPYYDKDNHAYCRADETLKTDEYGGDSSYYCIKLIVQEHVPVASPSTASAGPDQTVNEGDNVTLHGSGSSDPDNTIASYSWNQTAGTKVSLRDASSAKPSFTAPNVGPNGDTLTFELKVTYRYSAPATDTVNVKVNNVIYPPTASAGAGFAVDEGTIGVPLKGSGTDLDGTISSYRWEQVVRGSQPTVILTNANSSIATFDAPQVTANTLLTFKLTATDNDGATATDTVVVTVNNVNQPPVAKITANPTTINEGDSSALDATGSSDSDGNITKYEYSQTAGTAGTITVDSTNPAKATFKALCVTADETATIQLKVTDNDGATSTATVDIAVKNVIYPPTASAGPDQTVNEGDNVTLHGSGTAVPCATIASYSWNQTAGTAVENFTNATSGMLSFTAPNVGPNGDTLTFELKVTDSYEATSAPDTVNVKVVNHVIVKPPPPSTNPPSTNPPSTNPPSTNPPSTNPPSTNPPSTNPPPYVSGGGTTAGGGGTTPPPSQVGASLPSPSQTPAVAPSSPSPGGPSSSEPSSPPSPEPTPTMPQLLLIVTAIGAASVGGYVIRKLIHRQGSDTKNVLPEIEVITRGGIEK